MACRRRRRKSSRRRSSGRAVRIKRGKRLLTWRAATKRFGVRGAMSYRRKFGIKKKR